MRHTSPQDSSDSKSQGRVALVTGGGRGIGRAVAAQLARAGCAVAVNYRQDAAAADSLVDEIVDAGGTARAFPGTMGTADAASSLVDEVIAEFGALNVLVCNAGMASRGQSVADTEPREVERVMASNALGAHYLCHFALPHLRAAGRGDIIMISSTATRHAAPNGAPYTMSKAALEALAFTLAKEELSNGIRANVIAPGLVATEMGDRLVQATFSESDTSAVGARFPFGRVCHPDDIAQLVGYLVSPSGEYINGQRIELDGGDSSALV